MIWKINIKIGTRGNRSKYSYIYLEINFVIVNLPIRKWAIGLTKSKNTNFTQSYVFFKKYIEKKQFYIIFMSSAHSNIKTSKGHYKKKYTTRQYHLNVNTACL